MLENQSGQSAPPPPIPPVPANPGAATGGQAAPAAQAQAPVNAAGAREATIRDAIQAAENAANAVQGEAGTLVPPPPPPSVYRRDPDIPPEVVPIIGIVFGSIVVMVIFTPIVRGIMKFIERRQDQQMVHGPAVANQLMQLQQSVDALAIEVERISESQRFTAKVMAEREKISLPSGKGGA